MNTDFGASGEIAQDPEYPQMISYLKERYHLVIDAEAGREGQPEQPITVYQIETRQVPYEGAPSNKKASTL